MNELNKEFSENPNRREEEERREKEEGRRRRRRRQIIERKRSGHTERKKWLLYSLVCFSNALKRTVGLARVLLVSSFLHFSFNNCFFVFISIKKN
jgi:hypothetical protein